MTGAGTTWILGGGLLLASVVVGVSTGPLIALLDAGIVAAPPFVAAALIVFAFGVRGAGSITARRPVGTAAITVLALVLVAEPFLARAMTADGATAVGYGSALALTEGALAAIGVTEIVRARVLPLPWLWAPAWALGACAAAWILHQVAGADARMSVPPVALSLVTVQGVLATGVPVFLGAIAIALGARGSGGAAGVEGTGPAGSAPPHRTR
ncbi:MAG: hypothetical protein ACTHMF_11260 [Leifsonia sp.]|uniref:hypothetical protein n=1 Tax=Leifsonia sp. TaxID=1870902 RepID=UPI003F7D1737